MYKNILTTIMLAVITGANAQVIIGGVNGTAVNKTSVLLEFEAGQNKGIIVPYVRTLPTGNALVGGSIVLDATNTTAARMKYYNSVTSTWVDLSGVGVKSLSGNLTNPDVITVQPTAVQAPELANSRVIIGIVPNPIPANFPEGALVLNSDTKAMVLPIVGTVVEGGITKVNIPNPSPGMMVYVINSTDATKKRLAVYNGAVWSYWKATP